MRVSNFSCAIKRLTSNVAPHRDFEPFALLNSFLSDAPKTVHLLIVGKIKDRSSSAVTPSARRSPELVRLLRPLPFHLVEFLQLRLSVKEANDLMN